MDLRLFAATSCWHKHCGGSTPSLAPDGPPRMAPVAPTRAGAFLLSRRPATAGCRLESDSLIVLARTLDASVDGGDFIP